MNIEFKKQIEVKYEADVFIAGAGPAGISAAITAARAGLKVFTAEKEQCFGGAATSSRVPAFMRFSDGVNFLAGGIGKEVFDKLYGQDTDDRTIEFSINTEKLKVIYDEMMIESGAKFLFETNLIDICHNNGVLEYAIVKGAENIFAVKAKVFIDATGNGFLSVCAGADYEKGNLQRKMMPATLCTMWGDIDWNYAVVELGKDPDNRHLEKAFQDNVFSVKDPALPGMWRLDDHYGGRNIGHVFDVDGTDEVSLTNAMLEARKRMSEYQFYYNHYLEGYEKAKILCTGDTLAIRETRRIVCEYMMTVNDYLSQHSFADEIGRYCYPIDIHSHTTGVKEETAGFYQRDYEKGRSYGISYRSLLPKNTGNLLVAGRCMGAERGIMGSLRVMPGCFITGMAAGIAAVESINQERSLRELDIISLGPFQALCHGQLA